MPSVYRGPITMVGGPLAKGAGTTYLPIATCNSTASFATEAGTQAKYYTDGYFANLRCYISTNAHTANITITARKNGADTSLSVVIGAGITGQFEDVTNYFAFNSGDLMSLSLVGAGTGNANIEYIGTDILSAYTYNKAASYGNASFNVGSATRYLGISTSLFTSVTTLTDGTSQILPTASVVKNLSIYLGSNARVTNTVFTLQKNGVDTGVSITVGGGLSGLFEDITNSESCVAGDKINTKLVSSTGTQTMGIRHVSYDIEGASAGSFVVVNAYSSVAIGRNLTRYFYPLGQWAQVATTETPIRILLRGSGSVNNLYNLTLTNTANSNSVLTLRKNGTNQPLSLTVGAAATGVFSDTSNSFNFVDGDVLSSSWVSAAGSGSLTVGQGAMEILMNQESFPPSALFQSAWSVNSNSIICGGL